MKKIFPILIFLFIFFEISFSEEELTGFIIDQTKTRIGHDFYEYFNLYYHPIPGTFMEKVNIIIEEQTDPRFGIRIIVKIGETIVYYTFLSPRAEDIEEKAKYAVMIATEYLLNIKKTQEYLEEEIN